MSDTIAWIHKQTSLPVRCPWHSSEYLRFERSRTRYVRALPSRLSHYAPDVARRKAVNSVAQYSCDNPMAGRAIASSCLYLLIKCSLFASKHSRVMCLHVQNVVWGVATCLSCLRRAKPIFLHLDMRAQHECNMASTLKVSI